MGKTCPTLLVFTGTWSKEIIGQEKQVTVKKDIINVVTIWEGEQMNYKIIHGADQMNIWFPISLRPITFVMLLSIGGIKIRDWEQHLFHI